MPTPLTSKQLLDREFLEIRCRILEIAAAFDRLGRAEGDFRNDSRVHALRESLNVVREDQPDRAERVQMIFSRPYEPKWREEFGRAE